MAKTSRIKRIFILFFLFSAILIGAWGYWIWHQYTTFTVTVLKNIQPEQTLVVERGDTLLKILQKLRAQGIETGNDLQWRVLAKQTGTEGRIQAGEYALEQAMLPQELLFKLRDGKVLNYRFTIVEGWNFRQLRQALSQATPLRLETTTMDDASLMTALGHAGQFPEGRFLPETYAYTRRDSDLDILKRAYADMQVALDNAWESRDADLPLKNKDEALTLASIIEKETGIAEERPDIAGVFIRRLKTGMRLQTDPTVIYGMGSLYNGNIRKRDLLTDTPYNTYTRDGLPPTPIAMPGRAALHAATHPKAGDTLFFVAVGDGSGRHVFSKTHAEHQAAVNEYVKRYRAQFPKKTNE